MGWYKAVIVAGIGSRRIATSGDILEAIYAASCIAGVKCDAIATLDRDGAKDAIFEAARQCGCDVRLLSLDDLMLRSDDCLSASKAAMARYGVPSVAEAAALAGAGPGSSLTGPRLVHARVTAAIAMSVNRPELEAIR